MMKGLNANHMIMVAVACAIALALTMAISRAGETPIYGPDGKYQGSVFDYGKTHATSIADRRNFALPLRDLRAT